MSKDQLQLIKATNLCKASRSTLEMFLSWVDNADNLQSVKDLLTRHLTFLEIKTRNAMSRYHQQSVGGSALSQYRANGYT